MSKTVPAKSDIEPTAPKRKRGRPANPARATAWIGAHVTDVQRADAHARAARAGLSVGAWIVQQCGLQT